MSPPLDKPLPKGEEHLAGWLAPAPDLDTEIREVTARMTRTTRPVRLQHDGPFRTVQEVTGIMTRVQERLDGVVCKLVGHVPPLPELVPPHDGLLGLTETICRNAVIRAQHMDRVLDLIEEQLS